METSSHRLPNVERSRTLRIEAEALRTGVAIAVFALLAARADARTEPQIPKDRFKNPAAGHRAIADPGHQLLRGVHRAGRFLAPQSPTAAIPDDRLLTDIQSEEGNFGLWVAMESFA